MNVKFIGEHLLWGNIGHFAVVLAFAAALLAAFSYYKASDDQDPERITWYKIARTGWYLHALSVLTIVVALFNIIYQHYFEYYYAWRHSSRELPVEYMISCFWEGQEGSFLLWLFWHVVLGTILSFKVSKWTPSVMAVMALCQVALSSMLLGLEFFGKKIGSSPFELLRMSKDMGGAPIFRQPDYLEKIYAKDGNGLNPLLQNYWMVIHPPVLFLGFASTIVPFAFAISGLWKRQFAEWIKPALPWALFSLGIFGTGIMMGGMWAYESLSFGGYWAWDPVENASLIPWLVMAAGLHTMVIQKATGHSLRSSFILITGSFLLVLYATFLTRSGILGNSSVHSFTDLGLSGQLLVFLFLFIIVTAFLIIYHWKRIPSNKEEQAIQSREFWMFIGSLILLLSALQVTITTSIPVFNKVFGTSMAPPTDVMSHYNNIQLPAAVIILMLTAIGQYFKYKNSEVKTLLRHLIKYAIPSLVLTGLGVWAFNLVDPRYILLLFSGIYAIMANGAYIFSALGGKINYSGGSIAHIGFGILMIGVLISSANKNVISLNQTGQEFFNSNAKDSAEAATNRKANYENILLLRGKSITMQDYEVTYIGDSVVEPNHYYKVDYKNNQTGETFRLYPNMQVNPRMGNVFNPDTRHYLGKDIFTHISAVPDRQESAEEYGDPETITMNRGDSVFAGNNVMLVLENISNNQSVQQIEGNNINLMITAHLKLIAVDRSYQIKPTLMIENSKKLPTVADIPELGMRVQFAGLDPKSEKPVQLVVTYKNQAADYVIMKAVEFPMINLVWIGTVIMAIGFALSVFRRAKEYRKIKLVG